MKTLVAFYSYTGNTKRLAQDFAAREGGDIIEIEDVRRPGKVKAYSLGSFAAMRGKPWPIRPLKVNWQTYDRIVLYSPVWAGNPPPAVNAFLEALPEKKSISVRMVSASGSSGCKARLEGILNAKGVALESFEDIKA